jgi:hypothetical protein
VASFYVQNFACNHFHLPIALGKALNVFIEVLYNVLAPGHHPDIFWASLGSDWVTSE